MPFAFMLLSIAVLPLWIPRWWERNRNKALVAGLLGLPVLTLYVITLCGINFVSVILQCGLGECHTFGYKLL